MKKLKSQKGFTLAEMLICVVTLLLLAGICTAGTNVAMNSYNRSLFESHSQMLESTLDMYLGDILRHSSFELDTTIADDEKPIKKITNPSLGIYNGWIELSTDGRFYVYKSEVDTEGVQILSEKVYTKALKILNFELKYNESKEYVTGKFTIESTVVSGLAKECEFKYRIVTVD